MKRFSFFLLLLFASCAMTAQEVTDSVASAGIALDEVTVRADRVIQTDDGLKVFPTAEQIESSADGYSLLSKLSLPQVKVDETLRTITANDMVGAVQVRINDIPASANDLLSLDMAAVESVVLIQHPGLRYGEGVGLVIDIATRRAVSGYTAGGTLLQALTARYGGTNAYAKLNRGRHEFSIDCGLSDIYYNKGVSMQEQADYWLADGSICTIDRSERTGKAHTTSGSLTLTYNLSEPSRYTFEVSLSNLLAHAPNNERTRTETSPAGRTSFGIDSRYTTLTPQLDLYFNLHLPHRQTLTANAVGSLMKDDYQYRYLSASPYAYDVESRQRSLAAEAVYEKQWRPATLSVGARCNLLRSADGYTGSVEAENRLNRSDLYLYSQLSGHVGRFAYKGGVGVDRLHYRQNRSDYTCWQIMPKFTLTYRPADCLALSYDYSLAQRPPRLALINDVTTKLNEMEYRQGNPDLSPSLRQEHVLTASLRTKPVESQLTAMYRTNSDTWMTQILRTPDNRFIYTESNCGDINMLYLSDYTTFHLLKDKLDFSLQASLVRSFNFADTYTHCLSAFIYSSGLTAYLGRFTLSTHADNGWKSIEGENKMDMAGAVYFSASCRLGRWGSLSATWQHPFDSNVRSNRTTLLNQNLHKQTSVYNATMGNMVSLRLAVNLSHGRRYHAGQKTLDNTAVEQSAVKM